MNNDIKLLRYIILPLTNEGRFFLIAYLWGAFGIITNWYSYLPYNIKLFGELLCDTYMICSIIYLLPNPFKTIIRSGIFFFIFTTTIIDIFCYVRLGAHITPQMIQLCFETNYKEASEFFFAYFNYDFFLSTYAISLLLIIIVTIIILYKKTNQHCSSTRHQNFIRGGVMILLIIGMICAKDNKKRVFSILNADSSPELSRIESHDMIATRAFYLPAYRIIYALHANNINNNQVFKQLEISKRIIIDSCHYTSPNIILVIGESYNKHHSQLYGYPFPTTPYQIKEMNEKRLYLYNDAVTNYNLTSQAFKNMLSLNDLSKNEDWSEKPLVTQIFRKAGYKTYFVSNQFIINDSNDSSAGAFINNKSLSKSQFDYRNNHTHSYDSELIACFDSLDNHDKYNFIIFHLIGQHISYHERFPQSFRKIQTMMFTTKDLSSKEQGIICDYDNATAYNDYVLNQIIYRFNDEESVILFIADHGEECYDDIKTFGRLHTTDIIPAIAKNEFEVPFWIWLSPSYKKKHPDIVQSIEESTNKPFYNGDLGHLLITLGGIFCNYYREDNDILRPEYKPHKRIINDIADYDIIMETNSQVSKNK